MPRGSKVLIVDDDKMLAEMYQERLEIAGFPTVLCSDGEHALRVIHKENPDVILLDIMMPHLNGYQTLEALKSDPDTKDIPVIMLTALMRDFNRGKAVAAGAADFLIKSEITPNDAIMAIDDVLTRIEELKKY